MHHFLNWYLLGPLGIIILALLVTIIWQIYYRWRNKERSRLVERWRKSKNTQKSEHKSETDPLLEQSVKALKRKEITFDIGFEELGLVLKGSKTRVLDGVTGLIEHGKTTAIMGPSGSGKTTFLTTLAGRALYGDEVGKVFLNGKIDSLKRYKKLVGFVPQEDIMHRSMTVEETLEFSAFTRLPREMSLTQKREVVEDVLDMLGLQEIRYSQIGDEDVRGISGGQRKRVNLGIEVVADPSVMFLDEPTSGLDSTSSKEMCSCLQNLAHNLGLAILAVIHQPRYEIFQMFDNVLLLGKGGRTVYLGPTKDVMGYFEEIGFTCPPHVNPADFLMDVIAGEVPSTKFSDFRPQDLFTFWTKSQRSKPVASIEVTTPSFHLQHPNDFPLFGTNRDFLFGFLLCTIMPIALPFCFYRKNRTLKFQYGGMFGTLLALVMITFLPGYALMYSLTDEPFKLSSQIFVSIVIFLVSLVALIVSIILVPMYRKKLDPRMIGHVICGGMLGPFFVLPVWRLARVTPKERYSSLVGFGCSWVLISLLFLGGNFGVKAAYIWIGFCVPPFVGAGVLVVLSHRYQRLPTLDRDTANFFYQVWRVFRRAIVQQTRNWLGVFFDLALPVFASLFLGVIYYNRYYKYPLIDYFPDRNCTDPIPAVVCEFLEFPQDDPFPGQASLTCLSLALAAVASSLRVFGSEKTVFKRESSAGLSTEAYYLGKSLAHLPIVTLAPLFFTLCFYSFIQPSAVFWEYYILFFLVYFTCSGIAYLISIIIPASMSQLVGVLAILVFMMFSGANPTLSQLKGNKLIPKALVYPSYLSLFRWSQELYYLISIYPYGEDPMIMENLYSYSFHHWIDCWVIIAFISFAFRFIAYVSLARKEE